MNGTLAKRLSAILMTAVLALVLVGTTACETRPTLSYGSSGSYVTTLQKRLITLHYDIVGANGVYESQTQHAVLAFQKVNGLARDGVVGPSTWAKLDNPYQPRPQRALAVAGLEVNLSRQVLYLTYLGVVTRIVDVSTGNGLPYVQNGWRQVAITPTGNYRVYSTYPWGWQPGPLGSMYRPAYFVGGVAVHGAGSVPPYPASHGCVRVTTWTMDRLWQFIYIGMPVSVYY